MLDTADRKALWDAAIALVDARSVIMILTEIVGRAIGSVGGSAADFIQEKFGLDLKAKTEEAAEAILWKIHSGATIGMDSSSETERWEWFHKLAATVSGASAGFVGAPGLAWDLPFTTGIIMRSVADIARSFPDETLESEDTRRACIEVFAFGGPQKDDDDAETGYFAVRSTLSHARIDQLIRVVATSFGGALSEKFLAQAVPIAGILAGGGLNYAFIDYYQQMARVHFAIRGVERRYADREAVRACFSEQVKKIKEERRLKK